MATGLEEAYAEGRRAWPSVPLSEQAYADWVRERCGDDLSQIKAADLYLACAVSRGDAAAIAAFESSLLSRVGQFVGRIDGSSDFVGEVTQLVRIKLLVGNDGEGKLAQYAGRGTLASWVCAAALRTAHDLIRDRARDPAGDEWSFDVLAASNDVELEVLRARHQEQFRSALRGALGALEPRERTLLRLYFLEQVTAARIGQMYGVHETTALRWIVRARDGIVERVQAELAQKLGLPQREFGELMALLRSRIDVTVGPLLRSVR